MLHVVLLHFCATVIRRACEWFGNGMDRLGVRMNVVAMAVGTIMASTSIRPGFPAAMSLYGEAGTIKLEGSSIVHWTVPDRPAPELGPAVSYGGVADPRAISSTYHQMQLTNVVESYGENQETPSGKLGFSSSIFARARFANCSAFAPGRSWIANAPVGFPFHCVSKP